MTPHDSRILNKQRLERLQSVKKEIVTFDEIQSFIDDLVTKTRNKYNGVYGIPRAGMLLAILYSYKANVPLLAAPQRGCLVLDDDIGSGLTLGAYADKYDTAVMFTNRECQIIPTYIGSYYTDDCYKVFSWNVTEDLRW